MLYNVQKQVEKEVLFVGASAKKRKQHFQMFDSGTLINRKVFSQRSKTRLMDRIVLKLDTGER